MAEHIDWSTNGPKYRYWFMRAPFDASLIKTEPGNYMFVKPVGERFWYPIYIGEADVLSNRLPGHEKWEAAVKHGATRVMSHTSSDEAKRLAEEKALIAYYNPVLNVQHRTRARTILG